MDNGEDGHLGHLVALTVSCLDQDLVTILLHLMGEQIAVEPLCTIILVPISDLNLPGDKLHNLTLRSSDPLKTRSP